VLIPGDISWAMKLEEALFDLLQIADMPGKKIIMKGNHDYWWNSLSKLRSALPESMYAMQNDCLLFEDTLICGTRGWSCPSDGGLDKEDEKIYLREAGRLRLSLQCAAKHTGAKRRIAMMHYPPFNEKREDSLFTQLFEEYGIETVLYGHLHGKSLYNAFDGVLRSVLYQCVSCDYLDFKIKEIGS